jgi:di/tricarboxylate transporter
MGIVFLVLFYRLLPIDRKGAPTMGEAIDIDDYVTEGRIGPESTIIGKTVSELRKQVDENVVVNAVVRGNQTTAPLPDLVLREGDRVLLKGEPAALDTAVARIGLELEGRERVESREKTDQETGNVEAVVGPQSMLVDQTARRIALYERFNVNLIAVSRSDERITERLRDVELRAGDVIVLQGVLDDIPEKLRELGCLPLASREIRLGSVRRGLIPIGALGIAIALAGTGTLPVSIAFFGAALLVVLLGSLTLREAYGTIEWPLLVMLGALIPVSEAIRTTGGADLIAAGLSNIAHTLPAYGAVALIMVAAMALTPFLNNAATVLVMAPIATSFATRLGFQPDALLMAVAVGAGCDFMTPIGHQCNTLVMGPGGYRFGDYARLGAPLSILVVLVGVPLIMMVWPMNG